MCAGGLQQRAIGAGRPPGNGGQVVGDGEGGAAAGLHAGGGGGGRRARVARETGHGEGWLESVLRRGGETEELNEI